MEPISLATGIISLVAAYLNLRKARRPSGPTERPADTDAGSDPVVTTLYESVREAAAGDGYALGALDRLALDPENDLRRTTARDALLELIDRDDELRRRLLRQYELAAPRHPATTSVEDTGMVSLHGDVRIQGQYVAGRDQIIGGPASRG